MLEVGQHAQADQLLLRSLKASGAELTSAVVLPEALATLGLACAKQGSSGSDKRRAEDALMAALGVAAQSGDPHAERRVLAALTVHHDSCGQVEKKRTFQVCPQLTSPLVCCLHPCRVEPVSLQWRFEPLVPCLMQEMLGQKEALLSAAVLKAQRSNAFSRLFGGLESARSDAHAL